MNSGSFSSKPSAWLKTKVFFFFSLIFFSFLLIGCGSGGGGSGNGTGPGEPSDPLSSSKELISFSFNSPAIKSANVIGRDVDITVDYYSTDLTPNVVHTGKSYSPAGDINLANLPATYTITAEDGTTKDYSVIVRRAFVVSDENGLVNAIDTITDAIANYDPINYITILVQNDITLSTPKTIPSNWANKHIRLEKHNVNPIDVTITGLTDTYDAAERINVKYVTNNSGNNNNNTTVTNPSNSKDITGFTFNGDIIKPATISGTNVDIAIDYYSNNLIPTVTHTGASYSPTGNINFASMPKTYTVSAADGTTKDYSVIVRRAFVVSDETGLRNAIDDIARDINSKPSLTSHITILVTNDIDLTGTNQRTIPYSWAGRNIILEKYNSSASNVIVSGLAFATDNVVGLSNVNIVKLTSSIATGGSHSLAIDKDGKLWVAGDNRYGQLGLSDKINRTSFQPVTITGLASGVRIVSVVAGDAHSFVLDSNGKLWSTGDNLRGQLGLSTRNSQYSFQPVTISGLASGARIVSVAVGGGQTIALDSNGKLWSAGVNNNGELGLDSKVSQNSFQPVTISGLSNAKIVSISAGNDHSLAVDVLGRVWSTGRNNYGQLGLTNIIGQQSFIRANGTSIISTTAGFNHSLALDGSGRVFGTGYNSVGQLGLGYTGLETSFPLITISGLASGARIVSIAAGFDHSLALDSDGKLWATGYNAYGELGLGDTINRNVFTHVPLLLF